MASPLKYEISITPQSLVLVMFFVALGFFLWKLSEVVLILFTSVVLASLISSATKPLRRIHIPRVPAVVIAYLLGLALFVGGLYLFIPLLVSELSSLSGLLPENSFFSTISGQSIRDIFLSISGTEDPAQVLLELRRAASSLSGGVFEGASIVFGGLINFVLILVISFFLAITPHGVDEFLRIVIPKRYELYAIDLWSRSERKIGLWLQGQILVALMVGALTYVGLIIVGVPYALLMALLVAVLELVPFGAILAAVPAMLFAFAYGGFDMALFTLFVYLIVQQIEGNILYPIVMKRVVGVPPSVVIISLLVGGTLAGLIGVVIAIPTAVIILEFFDDYSKNKKESGALYESVHAYNNHIK